MGIQEIAQKILAQAGDEANKVASDSEQIIRQLNLAHQQKLAEIKAAQAKKNQQKVAAVKRSYLVPARLKAKQTLLEEKQNIITRIYTEVGTERELNRAELNKLREDTEVKVVQILFG